MIARILKIGVFFSWSVTLFGQEMADIDTAAFSVLLDDFVVTAQYAPTHYKEAIHKVDIISREEIESRGVVTLDEAINLSPSLRIYHDPTLGKRIKMRGISSSNVSVLINGVPVIGRLNGAIDLSQINMSQIERIEIVEGALSNIYGSNAAGGVINIITKRNQVSDFTASAGTQIESIGQQSYQAEAGLRKGNLLFNAHGSYLNYDQFPVDSLRLVESVYTDVETSTLQPKYPFNPKEQFGMGGFIRYDYDDATNITLAYDRSKEEVSSYGMVRRPRYNPYALDEGFTTERSDVSLSFRKEWNKFFLDVTSSYNKYDRFTSQQRYYLESDSYDSLTLSVDTVRFNAMYHRAVLSYSWSDEIETVYGLNYTYNKGSGGRIVDQNNPDSGSASFYEVAPFMELKYSGIENLQLALSGRYIHHAIYDPVVTPSFHAHYTLGDDWTIRGSYAQGYRSPDLKELYIDFVDVNHYIKGSLNLEPERSHDFQLNVDFEKFNDFQASANIYHTSIRNRIDLVEYETLKYQYKNIDHYNVYGVQPAISFSIGDVALQSAASIGWWATNIERNDAPVYGRVFDINNSLQYTVPQIDVGLTVNHRHVGSEPRYYLDNEEVVVSDVAPYELIDLSLNRSFLDNKIKLTTGVKNILGTTQALITSKGGNQIHGQGGRNIVSRGRSAFIALAFSLK